VAIPSGSLRGLPLNPKVFDEFRTSRLMRLDRRYDEALESLGGVLASHPGNLDLKMEVGAVQERLGLFLDALATYCDVVRRTSWPARTGTCTVGRSRARTRSPGFAGSWRSGASPIRS